MQLTPGESLEGAGDAQGLPFGSTQVCLHSWDQGTELTLRLSHENATRTALPVSCIGLRTASETAALGEGFSGALSLLQGNGGLERVCDLPEVTQPVENTRSTSFICSSG